MHQLPKEDHKTEMYLKHEVNQNMWMYLRIIENHDKKMYQPLWGTLRRTMYPSSLENQWVTMY